MKFALFYEIPVPRPWTPESELIAYRNTLEQAVAEWMECDGVRLFNSGYAANVGVVSSLARADGTELWVYTSVYKEFASPLAAGCARIASTAVLSP